MAFSLSSVILQWALRVKVQRFGVWSRALLVGEWNVALDGSARDSGSRIALLLRTHETRQDRSAGSRKSVILFVMYKYTLLQG